MKLTKVDITNYRCFASVSLSLHEQMTVIVAENGQGKSTLLDAIRVGLWPFIGSFDLAKGSGYSDPQNGISVSDVRRVMESTAGMKRQMPAIIELEAHWGALSKVECGNTWPVATWHRFRESEASRTKTRGDADTKQLEKWAKAIQETVRKPDDASTLPVFGYYGTGRLWMQKRLLSEVEHRKDRQSEKDDFYVRTFAYRHCMDPASSFKYFRDWFIWAWKSRTNMNERKSATSDDRIRAHERIEAVQNAINAILTPTTGWHTLEYSVEDGETLVLNHDSQGYLSVDQLSDGIRSVLAMVGDLAYRCIRLNPHLGAKAPAKTSGIVLIDEVDMHLHPRWQQRILHALQASFPAIQFVVTTHSPQVITTMARENLRVIHEEAGVFSVEMPDFSPLGHSSGDALSYVMGVNTKPSIENIEELVAEAEQLIRAGKEQTSEAQHVMQQLTYMGYEFTEAELHTWRFLADLKHKGRGNG